MQKKSEGRQSQSGRCRVRFLAAITISDASRYDEARQDSSDDLSTDFIRNRNSRTFHTSQLSSSPGPNTSDTHVLKSRYRIPTIGQPRFVRQRVHSGAVDLKLAITHSPHLLPGQPPLFPPVLEYDEDCTLYNNTIRNTIRQPERKSNVGFTARLAWSGVGAARGQH